MASFHTKNENLVHVNLAKCSPDIPPAPALEAVDFLVDCPLFFSCGPGIKYDMGLVLGNKNQLSDGQKYQILKRCDHLPKQFLFPPQAMILQTGNVHLIS